MKDLTDRLYVNWNALETSEEYNIMRKYAKNGRRYSLGYSSLYLFLSMSLIPQLLDVVLPLNKSRSILLTYPGYYFVDEREYFFYIFFHAIVAWEIAMIGIVAHDCIFVTYVEHVCSMFAVVGFRLEHLFYNRNDQVKTINTDDAYCKRIAFIVHVHRKTLKYAQLLEDTFNVSFAMQILIVTIGMSITLLQIKVLIDRLFLEWDELETPEEYEIMKRYAKNGKRYSLGYSLYCFISAFLFLCMSLIPPLLDIVLPLNESRPILPVHPGYYFVDEKEYFFYIFWHAVVVWEIAVTGIVAHDCMLLTYIEHVCSIFALGGIKVLYFSYCMEITQHNASVFIVMRYVVYVLSQLIHLFCLSFEGQKLIDHSLQTRDKIYNSLWYTTTPKSQRMLLFVMQKALHPVFLSACKIYIFSRENFTMVKIK
ncbi:hypothetical protein ALC53_11924 [Atta colombica]|uniref:Odorant receptor n=1 Tax=Atta colombica TaxID=520822 RepID=A0A151I077_9HYME|nr:hypothetical protein ALC53_11924 [Atta colombica]